MRGPWELYSPRERRVFLLVLFLVCMSAYVDRSILNVLLEPIKHEFEISDTALGLLSGFAFALFYATLGIPVARWADRGDRPLVVTCSLACWSLMTALCGAAQSFWQLAAARIGVGAGEAGAIAPGQSLVVDYFPPERRGRALSLFMMGSVAGVAVGLAGGGLIAQAWGWRAAFLAMGLPGLLLALATWLLLKEPRRLPGYAITADKQETLRQSLSALCRKPSYLLLTGGSVLYYMMVSGSLSFLPAFLMRVHGLSVAQAGMLYAGLITVAGFIGTAGGGWITDRYAARDPAWTARLPGGGLVLVWPLFTIALLMPTLHVLSGLLFIAFVILLAAVPPMFAALHLVCGSRRRATSIAIVSFCTNLIGLGLGPLIAGALSDAFAREHGAAEGLRYAMVVVMVIFLPAGWLMLRASRYIEADTET